MVSRRLSGGETGLLLEVAASAGSDVAYNVSCANNMPLGMSQAERPWSPACKLSGNGMDAVSDATSDTRARPTSVRYFLRTIKRMGVPEK